MYYPQFPYKGDQVIIGADRVHLLAKTDSVILMGDKSVFLSSPGTINIDSNESVLLDAPIVELGHDAKLLGQPVILGESFIRRLSAFLQRLNECGEALETVASSDLGDMTAKLRDIGTNLKNSSSQLKDYISISNSQSKVLSKTTYTR